MAVILTTFSNVRDRAGRVITLSDHELETALTEHRARQQKDGGCFVAGEATGRGNDAVRQISLACIDFDSLDEGEVPHDVHVDNLAGLWQAWHTTYSHTPAAPRWRLVMRLSRPVTAAEYRQLWPGLLEMLGHDSAIDRACNDPARLWYWPSCPVGGATGSLLVQGTALDVDEMIGKPAQSEPEPEPAGADLHVAYMPIDGPEGQKTWAALQHVSADCGYDEWLRIGMALHATYGRAGLEIWDTWSALGSKYVFGECQRKWAGFVAKPDGITIGSLYKIAAKHGYVETAPQMSAPEAKEPARIFSALDIAADGSPYPPFLIHEVIEEGGRVLLAAPPKAGKSGIMLDMMLAMATGTPWLQQDVPTPRRTLWINAEMTYDEVRRRIQAHPVVAAAGGRAQAMEMIDSNLMITEQWTDGLGPAAVRKLADSYRQVRPAHPPDVIVIDPLTAVLDVDENDNRAVSDFLYKQLETLRQALNPKAAVVIVHHARKVGSQGEDADLFSSIRGAGAIRGWYSMGIVVAYTPGEAVRQIHFESRSVAPEPIPVAYANGTWARYAPMGMGQQADPVDEAMDALRVTLQSCWDGQVPMDGNKEDLCALLSRRTGCSYREARAAIVCLKEEGIWELYRVGSRNIYIPAGPKADDREAARLRAKQMMRDDQKS